MMLIYLINREVCPLITTITQIFWSDASQVRATDYPNDICKSAILKLQSLKEVSDYNDCPICDEDWIDYLFKACSHCQFENMQKNVFHFNCKYEKAVHEKLTPVSFFDLVLHVQLDQSALTDWGGWKLLVKSKEFFAQAARSSKLKGAETLNASKEDKAWMSISPADGHGFTHDWLSNDPSGPSSSKTERKCAETAKGVQLEASKVALNALQAVDATNSSMN